MSEQIKFRIIGGVVVLFLAALFVPKFFITIINDSHYKPEPELVEIVPRKTPPPSVEIEKKLLQIKQNTQTPIPGSEQSLKKSIERKIERNKEKTASGLDGVLFDETGIPVRWVVQVASLRSEESANKFKQQLAAEGFPSFTRKYESSNEGIIHGVYVGPTLQQEKAKDYRKAIDKLFRTKGVVRRWN